MSEHSSTTRPQRSIDVERELAEQTDQEPTAAFGATTVWGRLAPVDDPSDSDRSAPQELLAAGDERPLTIRSTPASADTEITYSLFLLEFPDSSFGALFEGDLARASEKGVGPFTLVDSLPLLQELVERDEKARCLILCDPPSSGLARIIEAGISSPQAAKLWCAGIAQLLAFVHRFRCRVTLLDRSAFWNDPQTALLQLGVFAHLESFPPMEGALSPPEPLARLVARELLRRDSRAGELAGELEASTRTTGIGDQSPVDLDSVYSEFLLAQAASRKLPELEREHLALRQKLLLGQSRFETERRRAQEAERKSEEQTKKAKSQISELQEQQKATLEKLAEEEELAARQGQNLREAEETLSRERQKLRRLEQSLEEAEQKIAQQTQRLREAEQEAEREVRRAQHDEQKVRAQLSELQEEQKATLEKLAEEEELAARQGQNLREAEETLSRERQKLRRLEQSLEEAEQKIAQQTQRLREAEQEAEREVRRAQHDEQKVRAQLSELQEEQKATLEQLLKTQAIAESRGQRLREAEEKQSKELHELERLHQEREKLTQSLKEVQQKTAQEARRAREAEHWLAKRNAKLAWIYGTRTYRWTLWVRWLGMKLGGKKPENWKTASEAKG